MTSDQRPEREPDHTERDQAGQTARPRMNAQKIESWVDQTIQQAQRRGEFDNLPGAGKPLKNLDRSGDPDWWVKGMIEREKLDMSAAMPTSMALRREREGFPQTILHLPDENAVRMHLEDFNDRVIAERKRPFDGPGSPPLVGRVDVEEMLARWREATAVRDAQAAADGDADVSEAGAPAEPGGARRRRWWHRA